MSLASLMHGRVRSNNPGSDMTERAMQLNERQELLTAQGMPQFTEMSRKGNGFSLRTSTAFAPVAAAPTTTAALEIFNNTLGANAQVLVVKDLFAFQLLSTAATQTYGIWAMVTTQKAAPTAATLNIYSLSGAPLLTATAASFIIPAVGTTVVDNGWTPYGSVQSWGTAAATPGNSWDAPVDGGLLVPPGCSLCVTVAGSIATASSFQVGARFYMENITVLNY